MQKAMHRVPATRTALGVLPAPVQGDLSFNAIAPGGTHTCAVAVNGAAYCWGANANGQLGDGGTDPQAMPVPVLEP